MTPAAVRLTQEERLRAAFDEAASYYDDAWTYSLSGGLQREQVWPVMDRIFKPGERILDLACGTGADAIHLAARGLRVHATDISPEMLRATRKKVARAEQDRAVTTELCSLQELSHLEDRGPFDGAISNFGAINCISDLPRVAFDLAGMLRPGAPLLLCSMGKFCMWETVWYLLQAQPREAFRRGRGTAGGSLCSQMKFEVFYHSIAQIAEAFEDNFRLCSWRGVGVFVPPSYVSLANARPRLFEALAALDRVMGGWPFFRAVADHRLLLFERK